MRILNLAAQQLEVDVSTALVCLLETAEPWDDTDVALLVQPEPTPVPVLAPLDVDLRSYDQLLTEVSHGA